MRNVTESGNEKTDRTLNSEEEKVKKGLTYGRISGILALNLAIFQSKKLTCPKILSFISTKAINLLKTVKKFIIPTFSY